MFIDGASEIFNASASSDIAFPQNPYDRRSERGRSTYDRPQRFSVNGVFELPVFREQKGLAGQLRFEFFDVFNHTNFNPPVGALNSASFGRIQGASDPRILQFALRFTF
jgi:hypothetical protein